jgi:hypothetical protein
MNKFLQTGIIFFFLFSVIACSKSAKDSLQGSWKVSKLTMAGTEQDPELFGPYRYELKEDGSYAYTEGTKQESGKWSVSADDKQLHFEPAQGEKYSKELTTVTPDSVVLNFKSFTMDVKHVLVK